MAKSRKSKQKAKKIGIELWQYLADHPDIGSKCWIKDAELQTRINRYLCSCPLCEFYNNSETGQMTCVGCPLAAKYGPCSEANPHIQQQPYMLWAGLASRERRTLGDTYNMRRKNALKILDVMKGWDVE